MRCHAGPRETAGEASPLCRWLQDAKRAGARRSGQRRDWRKSSAASSNRSTRRTATLIRAVFESYAYVTDLVEDKNTSIRRLRQLFFGARTEKTDAVVGQKTEDVRGHFVA